MRCDNPRCHGNSRPINPSAGLWRLPCPGPFTLLLIGLICAQAALAQVAVSVTPALSEDPLVVALDIALAAEPLHLILDWGDGRQQPLVSAGRATHRYARPGEYVLRIFDTRSGTILLDRVLRVGTPSELLFRNAGGHISLVYFGAFSRGQPPVDPLHGATLGGELAFETGDKKVSLSADNVNLEGQTLSLRVGEQRNLMSLSYTNQRASIAGEGGSSLQWLVVADEEDAPRIQGLFLRQSRVGANAYDLATFKLGALDRYSDLAPGLTALRWRTDYQLTRTHLGATARNRTAHDLSVDLDGELAPAAGLELRPEFSARWRWNLEPGRQAVLEQRYQSRFDVGLGETESAVLELELGLETDKPLESSQALTFSARQLEPLAFNAGLSHDFRGGEDGFGYHAGASYAFGEMLELGASYRGTTGDKGTSNGFDASLSFKLAARPWSLRLVGAGGLQFFTDGRLEPSLSASLSGAFRGTTPFQASLSGNLRYGGERLAASLRLRGGYRSEPFSLSLDGGLTLGQTFDAELELEALTALFDNLSLQGNARYGLSLDDTAGSTLALGLGLRYSFGGRP